MESSSQKKSLGIISALLTVHVTIDFIMQPPKIFLRSKEVTLCVCVCMCVHVQACFFSPRLSKSLFKLFVPKISRDYILI